MDFEELINDKTLIQTVENFSHHINEIDKSITAAVNYTDYDKLSTEEKVKYGCYLSYTINSLYWMYVKLQGTDPNEHGVKNELSRVRQSMLRDKQIYERKTLRPTLDKGAATRFVKHGLHIRREQENGVDTSEQTIQPQNKRIRFDSSDENGGENNKTQ